MKKYIVIVAIIAVVLYLLFKSLQSDSSSQILNNESDNGSKTSNLKSVGTGTVLKKGIKSEEVKMLQSLYNSSYAVKHNKTKLVVDGIFGSKTESAIFLVTGKKAISLDAFRAIINQNQQSQNAQDIESQLDSFYTAQAESTSVNTPTTTFPPFELPYQ